MFNKAQKETFIKEYLRSKVIAETSLYAIFKKTEDFEEKLNSHDGYDEALDRYKRENGVVGSDFAKRMLDIEKQRMPTPYEKGRMNKGNRELGDWYNGKTKYKNGRYETEE